MTRQWRQDTPGNNVGRCGARNPSVGSTPQKATTRHIAKADNRIMVLLLIFGLSIKMKTTLPEVRTQRVLFLFLVVVKSCAMGGVGVLEETKMVVSMFHGCE